MHFIWCLNQINIQLERNATGVYHFISNFAGLCDVLCVWRSRGVVLVFQLLNLGLSLFAKKLRCCTTCWETDWSIISRKTLFCFFPQEVFRKGLLISLVTENRDRIFKNTTLSLAFEKQYWKERDKQNFDFLMVYISVCLSI